MGWAYFRRGRISTKAVDTHETSWGNGKLTSLYGRSTSLTRRGVRNYAIKIPLHFLSFFIPLHLPSLPLPFFSIPFTLRLLLPSSSSSPLLPSLHSPCPLSSLSLGSLQDTEQFHSGYLGDRGGNQGPTWQAISWSSPVWYRGHGLITSPPSQSSSGEWEGCCK